MFIPSDMPQIRPNEDIMRHKNLSKTLSVSSIWSNDGNISTDKLSRKIFNKVFESIKMVDSSRMASAVQYKGLKRNMSPLDLGDLDDVTSSINKMSDSKLFVAAKGSHAEINIEDVNQKVKSFRDKSRFKRLAYLKKGNSQEVKNFGSESENTSKRRSDDASY